MIHPAAMPAKPMTMPQVMLVCKPLALFPVWTIVAASEALCIRRW
jgi:hypothetical protein